jgi:hypothetical protein
MKHSLVSINVPSIVARDGSNRRPSDWLHLDRVGIEGNAFLTDDWESFQRLIPEGQLFTGKDLTFGIEQDNSDVRHHLARFRSYLIRSTSLLVAIAGYDRTGLYTGSTSDSSPINFHSTGLTSYPNVLTLQDDRYVTI